jgi:hypothetical protein
MVPKSRHRNFEMCNCVATQFLIIGNTLFVRSKIQVIHLVSASVSWEIYSSTHASAACLVHGQSWTGRGQPFSWDRAAAVDVCLNGRGEPFFCLVGGMNNGRGGLDVCFCGNSVNGRGSGLSEFLFFLRTPLTRASYTHNLVSLYSYSHIFFI